MRKRSPSTASAIPFGADLLFAADNLPGCTIGIEICEDLWAVNPPSGDMALAGATLLLNLSASNELLGKVEYRRELVRQQSARCLAAYLYAGSGSGESTTDTVWAGHSLIAENGSILAETERFRFDTQMAVADVDVQRLVHERLRNSTYSASTAERVFRTVSFDLPGETRHRRPDSSDSPPPFAHALRAIRPHAPGRTLPRDFQHPGHGIGEAAPTYGRAARRHRRLRRAGFDAGVAGMRQGIRPRRIAPRWHRRHHHAGVRHQRPHTLECGQTGGGH